MTLHPEQLRLEQLPCACFVVGENGIILTVNRRAGTLLHRCPGTLHGRHVLSLYADIPPGKPRAASLFERFRAGLTITGEVLAFRRADNSTAWGALSVQPIRDRAGSVLESRSLVVDVTAHHETGVSQELSSHHFYAAFEGAPTGMALIGTDGRLLEANRALCDLTGRTRPRLLRRPVSELVSPRHAPALAAAVANARALGTATTELRLRRASGHPVWTRVAMARLPEGGDQDPCVILHVQDVSESRLLQERLRREATHDELTGLLNRRGFLEHGNQLLAAAHRGGRPVTLLFFDVDGLKAINDAEGHVAGDRALVAAAGAIRDDFRQADVIARYGGDEFCILLDGTGREGASAAVARWTRRQQHRHGSWAPPVSIGEAVRQPGANSGMEALLAEADQAMYAARALNPRSGGSTLR